MTRHFRKRSSQDNWTVIEINQIENHAATVQGSQQVQKEEIVQNASGVHQQMNLPG